MTYDKKNVFAKIIRKELPAQIIYEDEHILSFADISKAAPVHILVIPKGRYVNLVDFTNNANINEIAHFFKKVSEIAKKYGDNGFRIISNTGHDAEQTVEHFHVHILAGKKLGPLLDKTSMQMV